MEEDGCSTQRIGLPIGAPLLDSVFQFHPGPRVNRERVFASRQDYGEASPTVPLSSSVLDDSQMRCLKRAV